MNIFLAFFPIGLLIYLMVRRRSWPAHYALPFCAVLAYLPKIFYFDFPFALVNATVAKGLLSAFTPILIVAGAVFLFQVMELTGSIELMRRQINQLTGHPVAQAMLIGWAFSFLIEGASGFGTPAALAAPMLVGIGFSPLPVAIFTLMLNSVPVTFGAVGTPIWFGLSAIGLTPEQLLEVGQKSAFFHVVAGTFLPFIALRLLVSWQQIRACWIFILLSTWSCLLPYWILAQFSVEFPTLVGGAIGLILTSLLAKGQIGLGKTNVGSMPTTAKLSTREMLQAYFPLAACIGLLIITRIPQLGLKEFLRTTWVLGWEAIGGQASVSWRHELLYVPSIIPFFVVGVVHVGLFAPKNHFLIVAASSTWKRMITAALALFGALVLVNILMLVSTTPPLPSAIVILGDFLQQHLGRAWQLGAVFLGSLGAFFSGSATVSALTFAPLQYQMSISTPGLHSSLILALQSVGGAIGNMICIHNIVAVCSILGLRQVEGKILGSTFWPQFGYGVIVTMLSYLF